MKRALLALAPALLAFAIPAHACSGPGLALIHPVLPDPLPEGAIVAEVELELGVVQLRTRPDIRARVIRMVQGAWAPVLILRSRGWTSCDTPFGNGIIGLIVAMPTGYEDGIPVVDPIDAPDRDDPLFRREFRLPVTGTPPPGN